MDLRCLVRICPGREGEPPGGTGYLIDCRRVLTAAHVVGEKGSKVEIEYDVENADEPVSADATVRWRGADPCDVAVLELAESAKSDVPAALLEDCPMADDIDCRSRGWPLAADDRPRVRDSMLSISGTISSYLSDQRRAQITIEQRLENPRRWKGISGAPVFAKPNGKRILAVIGDHRPDESANIFFAVPLTLAFASPAFCEALGSEIARQRRERLIRDVRGILATSESAAKALACAHGPWQNLSSSLKDQELADTLLTSTDTGDVLLALNRAHRSLVRRDEPDLVAARVVGRIFLRVAPLLIQNGLMHALPNTPGGVIIRLPLAYEPIAELAIAAGDGRPARYKPDSTAELEAIAALPDPVEPGFDVQGKISVDDYRKHFSKSLLTAKQRRAIKRATGSEPDEHELQFLAIDQELAFRAEESDQPLRRYLIFDTQFARDNATFITEFRRRLTSIHVVELTGGDVTRELAWERTILAFHARNAESSSTRNDEL